MLDTYERTRRRREKEREPNGERARRSVKKSTLEKRVCGAAGAAGCVVVYRRNRVARYGTPRSLAARSRLLPAGRLHDTLFWYPLAVPTLDAAADSRNLRGARGFNRDRERSRVEIYYALEIILCVNSTEIELTMRK